jgi:hypothetical protein
MKNLLIVIFLLIAFSLKSQNYGYLITVNNSRESGITQLQKTGSIQEVQQAIYKNTGLLIATEKIFEGGNVFFEYRNNGILLYCEKKILVRENNGELVLRKIKSKEINHLNDEIAQESRTKSNLGAVR